MIDKFYKSQLNHLHTGNTEVCGGGGVGRVAAWESTIYPSIDVMELLNKVYELEEINDKYEKILRKHFPEEFI